jgi:hypothetical protein
MYLHVVQICICIPHTNTILGVLTAVLCSEILGTTALLPFEAARIRIVADPSVSPLPFPVAIGIKLLGRRRGTRAGRSLSQFARPGVGRWRGLRFPAGLRA